MAIEHVVLTVKEGMESRFEEAMRRGKEILAAANGSRNVTLLRGHESPSKYLLLIEWDRIEDHVAFTQQPGISEFRGLIGEYMSGKPAMEHFHPA